MKFGIRELILTLLMVGLLGFAYEFGFRKPAERRAEMVKADALKEQELTSLATATAGIENVNSKIVELQQAISFFESKLPQEREIPAFLEALSKMGETNALQTRSVKTLKTESYANYSEQPIQMTLRGDFNGYYAFLLQLEKLQRITRITQMRLDKINDQDGQMQATVTLSIFFEPDAAPSVAMTP